MPSVTPFVLILVVLAVLCAIGIAIYYIRGTNRQP